MRHRLLSQKRRGRSNFNITARFILPLKVICSYIAAFRGCKHIVLLLLICMARVPKSTGNKLARESVTLRWSPRSKQLTRQWGAEGRVTWREIQIIMLDDFKK